MKGNFRIRTIFRASIGVWVAAMFMLPQTASAMSWEQLIAWLMQPVVPMPVSTAPTQPPFMQPPIQVEPPNTDYGIVPEPFIIENIRPDMRGRRAVVNVRAIKSGRRYSVELNLDCLISLNAAGMFASATLLEETLRFEAVGTKLRIRFRLRGSTQEQEVLMPLDGPCVKLIGKRDVTGLSLMVPPGSFGTFYPPGMSPPAGVCADGVYSTLAGPPPIGGFIPGDLEAGYFFNAEPSPGYVPVMTGNCSPLCPADLVMPCTTYWCQD
jgi:hypothetical protein